MTLSKNIFSIILHVKKTPRSSIFNVNTKKSYNYSYIKTPYDKKKQVSSQIIEKFRYLDMLKI